MIKRPKLYINLLCIVGLLFLTSCHKEQRVSLPGYVQARFTYISAYFPGAISALHVSPGEKVKAGQPLFTLEPLPQKADSLIADARVQQAIEQRNKSQAYYKLQKSLYDRNVLLYQKKIVSREELETSMNSYQQAYLNDKSSEANLLATKASQTKSTWALAKKTITAPMDSFVFDTYYSEHENASAGSPVLSLLTPKNVKVIFFAPETLISQLSLNQLIDISCDGCTKIIKAKITYLSPEAEYTPPMIYSEEERQHLVFRVEALPLMTTNMSLAVHPGQPVVITL